MSASWSKLSAAWAVWSEIRCDDVNVTQKQICAPGCCVLSHNKHLKLKRRESYQQNAELNIKCFYFARWDKWDNSASMWWFQVNFSDLESSWWLSLVFLFIDRSLSEAQTCSLIFYRPNNSDKSDLPPWISAVFIITFSLSSCFISCSSESPSEWRWPTAHTVSTVGRTSGERGSSATKASRCASAATPSSAPTTAPSVIDPSLWNQRCVYHHVLVIRSVFSPHTCRQTLLHPSFLHQELSHKGRFWHEECFRCAKCYKPLAKEPFSTKDDRIMCGKCCSKEDAPRCHGCYKPILAGRTTDLNSDFKLWAEKFWETGYFIDWYN